MTPKDFAKALLNGLNAPINDNNIQAIIAWEALEGGHYSNDARYNPLNTTWKMPGSKNFNNLGNGVGVQSYVSWDQGLDATLKTIKMGLYSKIIDKLMLSAPADDILSEVDKTPWGTHNMGKHRASEFMAYSDKPDKFVGESQQSEFIADKKETETGAGTATKTDKSTYPNVAKLEQELQTLLDSVASRKHKFVKIADNQNQLGHDFYQELVNMSQRVGMKPEDILAVMYSESGLKPEIFAAGTGGAVGLVQMVPSTLNSLGFGDSSDNKQTLKDFSMLSATEQLKWVEKLINQQQSMAGTKLDSAAKYRIANFLPASFSMVPGIKDGIRDAVLVYEHIPPGAGRRYGRDENSWYNANKGFDKNKKGYITYGDVEDDTNSKFSYSGFKKILNDLKTYSGKDYQIPISNTNQDSVVNTSPKSTDTTDDARYPNVAKLEQELKTLLNAVASLNQNLLIKINGDHHINNIGCANIISNLLDNKLGTDSFVHFDDSTVEIECKSYNSIKDISIACDVISNKFNEKYGSNVVFGILLNKKSKITPASLNKAYINNRMFKIINAGKNG